MENKKELFIKIVCVCIVLIISVCLILFYNKNKEEDIIYDNFFETSNNENIMNLEKTEIEQQEEQEIKKIKTIPKNKMVNYSKLTILLFINIVEKFKFWRIKLWLSTSIPAKAASALRPVSRRRACMRASARICSGLRLLSLPRT